MQQKNNRNIHSSIESLWLEAAELTTKNEPKGQLINSLMQEALDAEKTEKHTITDIAKQIEAKADATATELLPKPLPEPLAKPSKEKTLSFGEVKARMDSVAQLKPPQMDNSNPTEARYDFNIALNALVQQAVQESIREEIEPLIKRMIAQALDGKFPENGQNEK